MFEGKLESIFMASQAKEPMHDVDSAQAIAGKGLAGDRYGELGGTFAKPKSPDREVTLIEAEAVEAASREYQLPLGCHETRRNLVTRGVPLNHLVGQEFFVGAVRLRGIRLCEPCQHLEELTRPGVRKSLVHRGGLRAQVVEGGILKVGDNVRPVPGS